MDEVDIVIIGGGITGGGIAQAAMAAGFRVCLLEQGNIGAATSANSSKLIHGGLRYLETAQLNLVRKSLKERRNLLNLAPSLVHPVPFYIPIYQDSQRSRFEIRAGLSMYALLSEFDPLGRFESIPAFRWPQLSGLKLGGLKAVYQYWDAQTDDTLLTQAVVQSAAALGAEIHTQAKCEQIIHHPNGCQVHYTEGGKVQIVDAKLVINAAGPWVNNVLANVTPSIKMEPIDWVQGAHLLLDIPALDGILYLESCFDKRVVFVMPWYGKTLIGTTETPLASLDDKPQVTEEEERYLLGIYLHYFPHSESIAALQDKITSRFCGVRVLPRQASSAFERPRDTLFSEQPSHPNILTLYGGKLTTFRSSAQEVVDWIRLRLGARLPLADVDKLPLSLAANVDNHPEAT